MNTTYGSMPATLPAGFLCAVRYDTLMKIDVPTDGGDRVFDAEGAGCRELPLPIEMMNKESYGHDGAIVSGALFEVTVMPEENRISARGFLLDNEEGRLHALYAVTGAMKGNSAHVADVSARWEMDLDTYEEWVRFTKFNVAATCGVTVPAFADSVTKVDHEITAAALAGVEEIMASIAANPMEEIVISGDPLEVRIDVHAPGQDIPPELVASAGTRKPYDAFHRPESEVPHKVIVAENGEVYGHLGLWDSCHSGDLANCVIVPRPRDGYASFNQPGVLTERGIVETGPIFAYGGHRKSKGAKTLDEAYGGIENTWCDVRVTEGVHGPWLSGMIRVDVDDATVDAARASRISGHWLNGELKAIVSVNVAAFNVPGTGPVEVLPELAAGFSFSMDDAGLVAELVASFPGCVDSAPPEPKPAVVSEEDRETVRLALEELAASGNLAARLVLERNEPLAAADDDIDDEQATILLSLLMDD